MKAAEDNMTDIRYCWIPVEVEPGTPLMISHNLAKLVGRLPQRPAIYRWVFLKGEVPVKAYIGETENLLTRIRGYLNPGPSQATNKRMNAEFRKAVASGLDVRLDVLLIEPTRINRVNIRNENLSDPFLRRMMENFVAADHDVVNCELLNAALNPIERRKRKAMKDNPYLGILHEHGLKVD